MSLVSKLQALEAVLYNDLAPRVIEGGESVIDVGPGRLDKVSDATTAHQPGILLISDRCLYFRSQTSVIRMAWDHISAIERRTRVMGADLAITMTKGNWSKFYLGKVYSGDIRDFWLSRSSAN